jgi:hypothetical protein
VARLAALDTGERDRALAGLEAAQVALREAQLRETELQVRLQLQGDQIARLRAGGAVESQAAARAPAWGAATAGARGDKLVYQVGCKQLVDSTEF